MRAAEHVQLASLRHLFYLVGYERIVRHSKVDRLPAFWPETPDRFHSCVRHSVCR